MGKEGRKEGEGVREKEREGKEKKEKTHHTYET